MTAVTGPGYVEMDADVYHADPAPKPSLSSGFLADIVVKTVAEAKQGHPRLGPVLTPQEATEKAKKDRDKKYDLGSVAHTIVLGKGREIVPIDAPDWRTGAAQKERDAAFDNGQTPCLAKTYEKALAMRVALFEQLASIKGEQDAFQSGPDDHGVAEQAGFWQEATDVGKLWCRQLCDWRRTDRLVIRDYKTFNGQLGSDPDAFIKHLVGMGKDIQDPHYSAGYAAIASLESGEVVPWDAVDFKFIVQDPDPPYLVSVVALNDRQWSFERRHWAIDRFAAAAKAGLWRGFEPKVHHVDVPAWARTAWELRMIRAYEAEQELEQQGVRALALKDPENYRVPDDDDLSA
jgi:hypothetical protein